VSHGIESDEEEDRFDSKKTAGVGGSHPVDREERKGLYDEEIDAIL